MLFGSERGRGRGKDGVYVSVSECERRRAVRECETGKRRQSV